MSRARRHVAAVASVLASAAVFAASAHAADRIYWTNDDANTISFAELDGTGGGDLITTGANVATPSGLAVHSSAGRVYWANQSGSPISFANLDGSGGGNLNTSGSGANLPGGVAIDQGAGRIYWGNFTPATIAFANLDGSGGDTLNTSGATVENPRGVAVHPAGGRIYWSSAAGPSISFANLDGSGGDDLDTTGATLSNPRGVALDVAAGRIYWANVGGGGRISFANLDGSGGGDDLPTTGATVDGPRGVAIDKAAGRIYWANDSSTAGADRLSFANLDGSGGDDLATGTATVNGSVFPFLLEATSAAGAPVITGGSVPGSLLSCSQGVWSPDLPEALLSRAPQNFAYQWSVNGSAIGGATANTYTAFARGEYRCSVSASNFLGGGSQTSGPHAVSPAAVPPAITASLTRYVIRPGSFPAANRGPSARSTQRRRRPRPGGKVSFRLNVAGPVAFSVRQRTRGRRNARGRCVRQTPRNRSRRRCTRIVTRGRFPRAGKAGANSFRFMGRVRGRRLKPGRYLLAATPSAGGRAGKVRTVRFRIKRSPRR
jgi:hypothetical protein